MSKIMESMEEMHSVSKALQFCAVDTMNEIPAHLGDDHKGLICSFAVISVHPKWLHLRTQTGAEVAAVSQSTALEALMEMYTSQ